MQSSLSLKMQCRLVQLQLSSTIQCLNNVLLSTFESHPPVFSEMLTIADVDDLAIELKLLRNSTFNRSAASRSLSSSVPFIITIDDSANFPRRLFTYLKHVVRLPVCNKDFLNLS